MRKSLLGLLLTAAIAYPQNYQVSDVRVEGLEYLDATTVFATLNMDPTAGSQRGNIQEAIRKLYATELFQDVSVRRVGSTLVIDVVEYPVIADLQFIANKDVKDKNLKEMLRTIGVYEGQLYSPGKIHAAKNHMLKAYEGRGKYAIDIDVHVRELPRNRVGLDFTFSEGKSAKIREINITGNEAYRARRLINQTGIRKSGFGTIFSGKDKYNPIAIEQDITAIEEFYKNRGYMQAEVNYTAASLTADRENLYLDIAVDEGERYKFGSFDVVGLFPLDKEELLKEVVIKPGKHYRLKYVQDSIKAIEDRLGDEGFALARVNAIPTIDEEKNIVDFVFAVDAGERSYVRRINIVGNERTQDNVFRREIRQMEGSTFVTRDIDRSKVRIQRLPHVEDVEVGIEPVDHDQVDLTYRVKERGAGSITLGLSYGQESKFGMNAGFDQPNFMGTGHHLSVYGDFDDSGQNFMISYTDPYFTKEGISAGVSLSYSKEKHDYNNTGDYLQDGYSAMLHFGYPLSEYSDINLDIGYEKLKHKTTRTSPIEIVNELGGSCTESPIGSGYCSNETPIYKKSRNLYRTSLSLTRDTRNRTVFASSGTLNSVALSGTLPGSGDEFYKLYYRHQSYFPLFDNEDYVFTLRGDIMMGEGYGKTDRLPFYENFYAGGLRTVRGYRGSSLGERYRNGASKGGALRVNGTAELVMKVPGFADNNNLRWSTFIDGGQVYNRKSDFEAKDLRYSAGVSFVWLSPMGPLSFSYAKPLNKKDEDRTQAFQFSIGVPF